MITKIDLRPYRHKPNTWEADITMLVQGYEVRRRWKSPMPSRSASERWAREKALGFLADQVRPKQEETPQEPEKRAIPTLTQFAKRWTEQYVVANRLRDSTARNYRQDLNAHLIPLLGDLRLDQIDAEAVQRFKAARADRNMASTINKALGRLKTILRSAIEWKVITTMPPIKRLKEPKLEKPHYKQADDEKFLAAARKADLKLYTVILLGDDAGMRHGEIIALHKGDIRFDDGPTGAIVISKSSYDGKITPTKGNRSRRVPLTPRLRKALLAFLPTVRGEVVILSKKGEPILGKLNIADLTVELADLENLCELQGGKADLSAEVCNRGTNPVQDGVVVQFLETTDPNAPVEDAVVVCQALTTKLLLPGECEIVVCNAELKGGGNIFVDVDPEDKIADCHPGNNLGAGALGICPG